MHDRPFVVDIAEFNSWPAKAQCATAALLQLAGLNIDDAQQLVFANRHLYAWMLERDDRGRAYVWGRHGHDPAYRLEELAL